MQSLILTLYIIVCILSIILVLLQSGKEGMGVIFGGGNSSVFGSAGAGGILAKLTTLMAIIFVITALAYTYVTSSRPSSESVILDVRIEEPAPARAPDTATKTPESAIPPISDDAGPAPDKKSEPEVSGDNPPSDSHTTSDAMPEKNVPLETEKTPQDSSQAPAAKPEPAAN